MSEVVKPTYIQSENEKGLFSALVSACRFGRYGVTPTSAGDKPFLLRK